MRRLSAEGFRMTKVTGERGSLLEGADFVAKSLGCDVGFEFIASRNVDLL